MSGREAMLARVANAVIPGGGLILAGWPWTGAILALAFGVGANGTIAAWWIIPEDVPATGTMALLFCTAAVYVVAQVLLAARLAKAVDESRTSARHEALRRAVACLREGDATAGLKELARLGEAHRSDLLVAYRRAQLLGLTRDAQAVREAWQNVRVLDRHGLYREECASALREAQAGPEAGEGVT